MLGYDAFDQVSLCAGAGGGGPNGSTYQKEQGIQISEGAGRRATLEAGVGQRILKDAPKA